MPVLSHNSYGDLKDPSNATACINEPRIAEERKRNDSHVTVGKLVAQAKAERKWIFDPIRTIWYTPEEFKATYGHYCADNEFFFKIQLLDAFVAIDAGYMRVENQLASAQEFAKKVIEYYRDIELKK